MSARAAPSSSLRPSGPGYSAPGPAHRPALSSVKADTIPAINGQCCDDSWNPPSRRQGRYSASAVAVYSFAELSALTRRIFVFPCG
jgi:hypothetical protein